METKYEIVEHISALEESNGSALEVNLVSWYGNEPKIDIRKWKKDEGKPLKGVSLTLDEAAKAAQAITEYLARTGQGGTHE